ncbi:MAG: bifunctional demethylmenaquinone methyltransferase/2-methoxy-6-polyprenyl-1,4-benzoquinol methylase UbiE [Candidatus Hydrogenedentes bacterium]|nr:bifunctional demethylmenaquinone methyltransferase/2-methoxy-6-polyprenyl-1,4-benzoquinol methylase UbiE [Candidatus Hydrogenedentota bacterium]
MTPDGVSPDPSSTSGSCPLPSCAAVSLHRTEKFRSICASRKDHSVPQEPTQNAGPSRERVDRMFDRIAHRYDLLNRLLSFGRDIAWRKRMARHLPAHKSLNILDLATGTADVLLFLHSQEPRVARGVGVDPSAGMLHFGKRKIQKAGLDTRFRLVRGDGQALPLPRDTFDAVTIAFGIRNVADVARGLREMHRILRPGGRALILEFSLPGNALVRWGYLFYFRHVLPRIGGLISGDFYAYRYLNATVETFPYGDAFAALMREAGFQDVEAHRLSFGIATLYQGDKPSA